MVRRPERRRAQDADARRAQILDAAITIVGAHGFHGFALQDVARSCGLTNGGVLYHFGSKELLLLAVLEEHDRRLAEGLIAALGSKLRQAERGEAPLSVVLELLRAMMERAKAQPELTRLYAVLQAEALSQTHPAYAYFLSRDAMSLQGFQALVAPYVADPVAAARQIHALMDGLVLQWLRAERAFDIVAAWDQAAVNLGWRSPVGGEEGSA
jgi:AcrR family transcriptional regulator